MIKNIEWPKSNLNKKVVIIAISVAIVISIIGLTTDGFGKQDSKKNLPIIVKNTTRSPLLVENNTKAPSSPVPAGHHIEVNLNESMHFAAH
jgi:hypothetical protein